MTPMFNIFADTFKTATRTKEWDAPNHWHDLDRRPLPDHVREKQRRLKNWIHDSGIL